MPFLAPLIPILGKAALAASSYGAIKGAFSPGQSEISQYQSDSANQAAMEQLLKRLEAEAALQKERLGSESELQKGRLSSQEQIESQKLGEQKRQYDIAQQGYLDSLSKGEKLQDEGEKGFLDQYNKENPYLSKVRSDIETGATLAQQRQAQETQNALTRAGVTGSSKARLQSRASGDFNRQLNEDLNKSAFEDYINRRSALGGYYQNKAAAGTAAQTKAPYKYV